MSWKLANTANPNWAYQPRDAYALRVAPSWLTSSCLHFKINKAPCPQVRQEASLVEEAEDQHISGVMKKTAAGEGG